jgi:CheY-like chemotaxis protein
MSDAARILYIEDDPTFVGIVKDALPEFEIVSVTRLGDAMQVLASSEEFAALLVDINLTDLEDGSGYEILEFARERRPHLPKAVVTGSRLQGSIRANILDRYGVSDVLIKGDFNLPDLRVAVRELVSGEASRAEDHGMRSRNRLVRALLESGDLSVCSVLEPAMVEATLHQLEQTDATSVSRMIVAPKPKRGERQRERRLEKEDERFLAAFVAVNDAPQTAERLDLLVRLVYNTANPRADAEENDWDREPSEWRHLAWTCLLRLPLKTQVERDEDVLLRLWRINPFKTWQPDPSSGTAAQDAPKPMGKRLERYTYPELRRMASGARSDLLAEKDRRGAPVGDRDKTRRAGVDAAVPALVVLWKQRLRDALALTSSEAGVST